MQTNSDFTVSRCALNGNVNMRKFGLNNALMLCYAFAAAGRQAVLIHAALVRHEGKGYAFIAKSGTGKSTQASMWLRFIPHTDLMNDDNPVVRVVGDRTYVYGTPWSGKTPCYRNVQAPLGAIIRIDRAAENRCDRLENVRAFASVLPSCSSMKWEKKIFRHVCDTVSQVIRDTPVYTLHCLPDEASARICHAAVTQA